jgi:hypothetical protein
MVVESLGGSGGLGDAMYEEGYGKMFGAFGGRDHKLPTAVMASKTADANATDDDDDEEDDDDDLAVEEGSAPARSFAEPTRAPAAAIKDVVEAAVDTHAGPSGDPSAPRAGEMPQDGEISARHVNAPAHAQASGRTGARALGDYTQVLSCSLTSLSTSP